MDVKKTIIPAAGIGTNFLPFTKSVPKEMLPLLNKPALQYVIEEGVSSKIEQFIMVTSRDKFAIANHFDSHSELEAWLKEENKQDLVGNLEKIRRAATFTYVRQSEQIGLGHAVWVARHTIGKEYFGIMLPDDIIISKQPALTQLIQVARQEKSSVLAVQEVPAELAPHYGMIAVKKQITPNLFQVSQIIEKPSQKDTPSNLAVIGRYVLSSKLFDALEETNAYAVDELRLTDGINSMMKNNEKVFAVKISGMRYDIGNPIGWVKAIISMALQHPHYAPAIKAFLNEKDGINSFIYNQAKNISHEQS